MLTVVTVHTAPVVLPICAGPILDGAVAVEGERIAAVGPRADLKAAYPAAKGRHWPGILTPGLVNAHAHLQYTDFADLATSGLPFPRWIVTLSARRQTFDDTAWQASARRGIHLALTTGTTCLADVVTNPAVLRPTARSGLAGVSYVEAVAADDRIWSEHARATLLHALDTAPAGRAIGVSPHTLYTLGTAVYTDCLAIARKRGLRLHTHLAETAEEVEYVLAGGGALARALGRMGWEFELLGQGSGRTPVAQLDALGGLGSDVFVAHGVHVDAADRALLRARGTTVVLCVRSNAVLQAGEPPVAAYLAEGNRLAVGTDSLASSPSLDLLAELQALHTVARRQGAPSDGLARRLVEAATIGGAQAMGLDDSGALRPGARADLAAFDIDVTGAANPEFNPYAALVTTGAGRCLGTVLAGRLVHRAKVSP